MANSYSYSKLNSFNTCPRQYKFTNIERAAVEKPIGVEAYLGGAVHYVLEKIYSLKMNQKVLSVDDAIKMYRERWEEPDHERIKVTRENLSVDDYIKTGEDIIRKFYDKYAPFDQGVTIALEKMFSFPLDPNGRFKISGIVDRVNRREDGVIEIIDYKTKSNLITQQALDDDEQMALYQMGVKHLWPEFDKIELKQIFLRHGMELKTVMNEDKIEEIRYRVYQKILEIEQAVRDDNFPAVESPICDWCLYYELCPAKRHRLALDDEIEDMIDSKTGAELAEKYLELNHKKRQIASELDSIKEDLLKYCEQADLSKVEGEHGSVKVAAYESEEFPSKTKSENDFLEMSFLAREAGLEECFKLDQRVLYKEFFVTEKLPEDLMDKLRRFLVRKKNIRITAKYDSK